ncbi:MAG: hypothetical protein V4558_15495 [Gemmatimonadota bacterium]
MSAPCAAQAAHSGLPASAPVRRIRVAPSPLLSRVVDRDPLRTAPADGQPLGVATGKVSRQGRDALIGAGVGLVAGFIVGKQVFDGQDREPNSKLIALSSVVGALLGMAIGASVTH